MKIPRKLYDNLFFESCENVAIKAIKSLCQVDNFMIGFDLEIFKIISDMSHSSFFEFIIFQ